jgi:hypothetical protein
MPAIATIGTPIAGMARSKKFLASLLIFTLLTH